MNMEDSVAFRVRAKRGCATHPRSIAERVKNIQSSLSIYGSLVIKIPPLLSFHLSFVIYCMLLIEQRIALFSSGFRISIYVFLLRFVL